MKAFVIAETADAQKELCAGARTLADEVLLVSIGSAPRTGVADKAYAVELPQGELVENAYDAVAALYDEVAPNTVLFEPTPRLKIVGGRLAAHADASVMCDVTALDGAEAESLYFGGLGLELARSLASAVHGELACSRPLAENEKWLPKNTYLGVSGRMVSPKVYFAVGISGQMQHMIGVHNADVVVAVNKDQNAPVFAQADYGLVADLHEALPALVEKLS